MFVSFFNNLIKPVFNIVQNIASLVQQLSQVVANYAGTPQPPANTPAAQLDLGTTTTPAERERLRRQRAEAARQRKLARMEADFERDMAHNKAGDDDHPLKYPAGYLLKPPDADIQWLGDKEAQKVIQMMKDAPALIDTMLSTASSPKAAFDLLLAQGIDLSSEVLMEILASRQNDANASEYVGLLSDSVVYQGNTDHLSDPCSGADEPRQCYLTALQAYGINMMSDADLNVHIDPNNPEKGTVGSFIPNLEQFSTEQLGVILQGVDATAQRLAEFVEGNMSPEEAFQLVYGQIEFGYDSTRKTGLTVKTGDPTNPMNPMYIILDDSSFGLGPNDTEIGFNLLPDSFVVVHELAHALVNRIGLAEIDTTSFVEATNSLWNPTDIPIEINADLARRVGIKPNNQGKYLLPSGAYIPLGFTGGSYRQQQMYFYNEFNQLSPDEGFADAFSLFVNQPSILEDLSLPRNPMSYDTCIVRWGFIPGAKQNTIGSSE